METEGRAKRQKKDRHGRSAAFEKLKQLKGSKNKCDVDKFENVYDIVDEQDYTKKVLDRQDDDWIVDDDGSGYIEDGREIFDDDLDSESIAQASSSSQRRGNKRKKKAVSDIAGKGNLQFMLSNMPNKKKEEEKLGDDDILSEIISEMDIETPSSSSKPSSSNKRKLFNTSSVLSEKRAAQNYIKSLQTTRRSVPVPLPKERIIVENEDNSQPLHEIDVNVSNEDKTEIRDEPEEVKEAKPAEKKLLFKIEIPKKIVKVEEESLAEFHDDFADIDFDEDAFGDISNASLDESGIKENLKLELTEEQLFNGWTSSINGEETIENMEDDLSSHCQEEGMFQFFWWDAYENPKRQPGTVLFFGKKFSEEEKKYVSCCLTVKNIQSKLYLLPRRKIFNPKNNEQSDQPVTIMDVYQEFKSFIEECGISTFKSRKVSKNYAFDANVPFESEYLEVRFDGHIDLEDKVFKSISHVFGVHSTPLEIILLERKIKGPCWLTVKNPEVVGNPYSYTKIEVVSDKPSDVTVLQNIKLPPPPPLTVLALNIKVANVSGKTNEIAMISCLINNKYYVGKQVSKEGFQDHFCIVSNLTDQRLPINLHVGLSKFKQTRVHKVDSERALLNIFLTQFSNIDPDLIVGHDLTGYQLSVLANRLLARGTPNISRLSRIKRDNGSLKKFMLDRNLFSGRLVCDLKISAKELIKSRSYDLDALCQSILKVPEAHRIEVEPEDVAKMYVSVQEFLKFIIITMQDCSYIIRMLFELNVIPLALQITNIAGNIMSRTLMGGRSERNEFLLLHAFYEKDYIVPEKKFKSKVQESTPAPNPARKKPTYSGGLVLDPKVGFYETLILLMDFNSLYPSIIQEYNICFTTILETDSEEIALPDKSLPLGILPTEIRKLVESRREVKNLMKNPDLPLDLKMQYHIRQMALKLTANSMYGCLGFTNSRFFAKSLAALVTQKGREILTNTRDLVMKLNYDVIYGDTDSIMINTNILDYDQVFKIGRNIKFEINKMYKQVELDIDGVFKYLLLLKKKKYAAISLVKNKNGDLEEVQEFKGLDIVRRDWSGWSSQAGKFILNQILSNQTEDERIENINNHLIKLKEDIEENKVPLILLVITKQLTKDPHLYPDKNSLPHVQVALRNNKLKGKKFKAGDTVNYIICNDGTTNSAVQRAYLMEELKNSEELTVDTKYYLAQQIHPVISRICEPIEGVDAYLIANLLGLDATAFKPTQSKKTEEVTYENIKKIEIKFRNVKPFTFLCIYCNNENNITDVMNHTGLDKCGNVDCLISPMDYLNSIKTQLLLKMRDYVRKYYKYELICEDPSCPHITTRLPQTFYGNYPVCTLCHKGVMYQVYTERELYMQLLYYQHIFDVTKMEKKLNNPKLEAGFTLLKDTVQEYLKKSNYSKVDLSRMAGFFLSKNNTNKGIAIKAEEPEVVYEELSEEEL